MVREYGLVCAVTGAAPAEVLEAAHLRPFASTERHRVEEGLLLRSDIHRLFDSGLLAVSRDLVVSVAPSLAGHASYHALDDSLLELPPTACVNRELLADLYAKTTATW
ncbi:HNH endonuclease (plasmid) [Streptomyces sp. HU2014]|uniref:HNH endonuclease signature motif containing protein n=1 Tax=Streptomyces sp. HU2014 TaxID=2939414 RepID=UPI00200EC02A|nr:HNH endonuclease signature motif containing protein [Streptomyces sp. HU2014]UQI49693.1 HNH endonuclease [Streptomyces sp. HU2014]